MMIVIIATPVSVPRWLLRCVQLEKPKHPSIWPKARDADVKNTSTWPVKKKNLEKLDNNRRSNNHNNNNAGVAVIKEWNERGWIS